MRALFIHHSTGAGFLKQGRLREELQESTPGIELWDQGYIPNGHRRFLAHVQPDIYGLRDGQGSLRTNNIEVPDNNTNPDGLARLFEWQSEPGNPQAIETLFAFDVIAFKSCFPVSNIVDEAQFESYQRCYERIRDVADGFPTKLFVVLSPPPLRKNQTTPVNALRARRFSRWLGSDSYLGRRTHMAFFDLFDTLAEPETQEDANTLRRTYMRSLPLDSHPNRRANQVVGLAFAQYLSEAIRSCFPAVPN